MSVPEPSDNTPDLVHAAEVAVRIALRETLVSNAAFRFIVRRASAYGLTFARLAELTALDEATVYDICDPFEDAA